MTLRILALFLLFANTNNAQNIEDLSNKFWRLKSATINGNYYDFSNDINVAPTMQFSGGNIRGNGGCNAYHTKFTLFDRAIEFDFIKSTKMACNNLKINENEYFEALAQRQNTFFYSDRNELVLKNISGDVLTFFSQFARSENSITTPPVYRESRNTKIKESKKERGKKGKKGKKGKREKNKKDKKSKKSKNKKERGKKDKKSNSKKDKKSSKKKKGKKDTKKKKK
jgi:heat shock protein HslJ